MRGRGGAGYSFVACPSHLTIDHASLSRRSTLPSPNRDTSNIWALITLIPHILHRNCVLILSPSRFAVCGHHISPRIAIVFSLLSNLPNSSMSRSCNFLISPTIYWWNRNRNRVILIVELLLLYETGCIRFSWKRHYLSTICYIDDGGQHT